MAAAMGCEIDDPQPEPVELFDPDDVPITAADVDLPKTYTEAVVRVRAYRDRIRDAVAAGTPSKAHRPLDELEIVLYRMPQLARDSGVPKRQWETVVVASEDISELFNKLHSAIDDHRKPDYAGIGADLEDAINRLRSAEPPPVSPPASDVRRETGGAH